MKKWAQRLLIVLAFIICIVVIGVMIQLKVAADAGKEYAIPIAAEVYAKIWGFDKAAVYLDKIIHDRHGRGAVIAKMTYSLLYIERTGGKEDDEKAMEWLYQAVTDYSFPMFYEFPRPNIHEFSAADSKLSLEEMLSSKMTIFLKKRANEGSVKALYILASINNRFIGDQNTALIYLKAAAEKGLGRAQYALAYEYLGHDNNQKTFTAEQKQSYAKWVCLAAKAGVASAEFDCARTYHQGFGVGKDLIQSYLWNSQAQKNKIKQITGDFRVKEDADKLQLSLEKEMTPEQIAEAKKLAAE